MVRTNPTKRLSAAEKRYNGVTRRINGLRKSQSLTRQQEEDIAYIVNEIDKYGFQFSPNHYLFDKIDQIENVLNRSTSKAA